MKRMLAVLSTVLLSSMLIVGCDGGHEVSDGPLNRTYISEDTVVLNGIVAMDEPLQGVVQAINTRGETSDAVIAGADGRFTLDIPNYRPFMLRIIPRDQGVELFSFAPSAGHVNLTPLTHLAMYVAVGSEVDLETLFHEWDGSQLSPEEVQMAAAMVSANLAPLLDKQGLDHRTYDFFHTDFKADGTGMDAVLDSVRIHIDTAAETLSGSIRILDPSGRQLSTFDAAIPPATNPAASPATGQKQEDRAP